MKDPTYALLNRIRHILSKKLKQLDDQTGPVPVFIERLRKSPRALHDFDLVYQLERRLLQDEHEINRINYLTECVRGRPLDDGFFAGCQTVLQATPWQRAYALACTCDPDLPRDMPLLTKDPGNPQASLLQFMARACHYAQDHVDNPDAWDIDASSREPWLQCTSYQVACFLAQHTVLGANGVGWEIIINDLTEHPMKSVDEWEGILQDIVHELGGWAPVTQS